MKPTRPLFLVGLVLVIALVTWVLVQAVYGALPVLPWTAVPTFLLLALGEAFTAFHTLRRIRRKPGTRPVEPLVVARMAALAKASAHAAAVFAGVFGGFVLALTGSLDMTTPRADFFVSAASGVSALVLVGAALFLEYACRVPHDPEDEARDGGASRA
ncbi:DUF3180 domain-containing protein [Actinomadura flavalba]|uniref:DUF3180 domain-containing protein n=1 Tax=Actinomadura flavalba TaxID=1120938 RepID=UPI000375A77F|nr:DUF3180 domain-containing protein [Actinomadura flavalba]